MKALQRMLWILPRHSVMGMMSSTSFFLWWSMAALCSTIYHALKELEIDNVEEVVDPTGEDGVGAIRGGRGAACWHPPGVKGPLNCRGVWMWCSSTVPLVILLCANARMRLVYSASLCSWWCLVAVSASLLFSVVPTRGTWWKCLRCGGGNSKCRRFLVVGKVFYPVV